MFFQKSVKQLTSFLLTIFLYIKKIIPLQNKRTVSDINSDRARKQTELDKKLVYSLSKSRIPTPRQLKYLKKYLSKKELLLIRVSVLVILLSIVTIGTKFYFTHLEIVPVAGGVYEEALVGAPQHVNPLYSSVNDVDSDISHLIFSSLFKRGKNSELINDLVKEYEIGNGGRTYTIKIRRDAKWHDGSEVKVDDVIFTFNAIKNNQYKSPLRLSFSGVEIERVNDETVRFNLPDPYAAFLDLLTFGIIPADVWYQVPPESATLAELNLRPIGSGPYIFKDYVKDKMGSIKEYRLIANEEYYGNKPLVDITFKFYPLFEEAIAALNNNTVDGISYLPRELKNDIITPKTLNYNKLFLPQLTVIFFNQSRNVALADKAARQALAYAIDRSKIINEVLGGDGYLVDSPILSNSFAYYNDVKKYDYNIGKAEELLDNIDWKLVEITEEQIKGAEEKLSSEDEDEVLGAQKLIDMGAGKWRMKDDNYFVINLSTVEKTENEQIIQAVKEFWETIGVKTNIFTVPANRVQQEIIKPREFDAFFYSQIVGADPDPYAFWHSSQAGENGFNISSFNNKEVDELLEDARLNLDISQRQEKYKFFQEIITEDEPAIFMYSPVYVYAQRKKVKGYDVKDILVPSDRFVNVHEWYIETGKKLIW